MLAGTTSIMKTIIVLLTLTLGGAVLFAQGTFILDNNIPGTLVAHIYLASSLQGVRAGNGPNDTPPGTQDYSGFVPLAGPGYSAQLYARPGVTSEEASLVAESPVTSFLTGAAAGFLVPVTVISRAVPPDAPVATVQLKVWDNEGGTASSWDVALTRGQSELFVISNIGGQNNPPPILQGLQSFSIRSIIPEPSPCTLLGFGAVALTLLRRRK
jgi:hypothetical protein